MYKLQFVVNLNHETIENFSSKRRTKVVEGKDPENRTSDYVCFDCGVKYVKEKINIVATFHTSNCGLCGRLTGVTHIRNYNYLRGEQK